MFLNKEDVASGIEGNDDGWEGQGRVENSQSQTEQLGFDEVESRTCASIFNVENDIIKVSLRYINTKYSKMK